MINYLLDCQKTTPIGMIPEIIQHNNAAINDEFAWIYDVSMNRLTKSVYTPTGSVKAHTGEFVNLSCEYLTIKNTTSLQNYIKEVIDDIVDENAKSHNTLEGRFSVQGEQLYEGSKYCHDAASIVYNDTNTVYDMLNEFDKGNLKIKYGDEIYTGAEIAALIEWKKSLKVQPIVIADSSGYKTRYNVLCEQ